jgi:DNA polymerase III epsilon subunit-like protein
MENRNRILVFDVETTGLLPKMHKNGEKPYLNEYPYILQLSFVLYNTLLKKIESKHDYYIKIPSDIIISEKITELTGITREMVDKKGVDIVEALDAFYTEYTKCGCVIGHNVDFDKTMIKVALQRNIEEINRKYPYCMNIFNLLYEQNMGIRSYCTMKNSMNVCNILISKKDASGAEIGKPYKKWPTLLELHQHLFESVPENLHNSLVDVLVCLKCYLQLHN